MNLRSRATVAGAVTLITMAICFFGVRAELETAHRLAAESAALDRAEPQSAATGVGPPPAGRLTRKHSGISATHSQPER
jgi:hypothetical protein